MQPKTGFTPSVIDGDKPDTTPVTAVPVETGSVDLPLMGRIAAGVPIEAISQVSDNGAVPQTMLGAGEHYAVEGKGDSMIDDGIHEGDILVIQNQKTADNSEIIVATVDNEATVKRFYLHNKASMATPQVELRPSNQNMESMWYSPEQVEIRGIVIGLLRKF